MREVVEFVENGQLRRETVNHRCNRCERPGVDNQEYGEHVYRFDFRFYEGRYTEEKVDMYGYGIEDICPLCADELEKLLNNNGFRTTLCRLDW